MKIRTGNLWGKKHNRNESLLKVPEKMKAEGKIGKQKAEEFAENPLKKTTSNRRFSNEAIIRITKDIPPLKTTTINRRFSPETGKSCEEMFNLVTRPPRNGWFRQSPMKGLTGSYPIVYA
jgi:hypothetical protein